MKRALLILAGLGCSTAGLLVGDARLDHLAGWCAAATRPLLLPFLWRTLAEAQRSGNPAEAFAKAQQLLALLPGWVDGHTVFAYRYALDGGDGDDTGAARVLAAKARLDAALALLEAARPLCGARESELLFAMGFLVELMARNEPGLEAVLAADPGAGPSAVIFDRYLSEAERVGAAASVREYHTFLVPGLAAALLRSGDTAGADAVLTRAIERCAAIRDRALGEQWRATLLAVRDHLRGGTVQDRSALLQDQRLAPLHSFLR